MAIGRFVRREIQPLLLAIGSGFLGGLLFNHLNMPLPWMLGGTIVVTILALAGARVRVQFWLREPMVIVIATMLGSSFTPDVIGEARQYLLSMSLLALYVLASSVLCWCYLHLVAKYDQATAYFCAIPGGLMEMVILGAHSGADERKIFLAHGTRVLLVVLTVPLWFRLVEGYVPPGGFTMGGPGLSSLALTDAVILLACGVIGYFLGKLLHFPAFRFTGPLTASAIAHLTGLTTSKPPGELIVLAQIILGSSLGCRYVGVRLGEVMGTVRVSLIAALLLLVSAIVFAYGIHLITGFNTKALVLSLSPGGLVEMTLIALALGIDVAFITIHHLVRITLSVIIAPTVFTVAHRKGWLQSGNAPDTR